ncbi:fido (protein-threonine AMPylation protein) [Bartonella callosciuri]|uniref:protein adenylyltransferase n=1 Tax=Bartonella callosciuri TaxID=686223 RepID=A0A840NQ55_9HYPH|nr:BID domain-containing T4SS effector [Bartonella callosciuri]MBB5073980.1 fido (protein-threonine AMPylation protein) [Bartonella callosciuri]
MPKAKSKTKGIPSPHHYIYPGTKILKNKYGETNLKLFLEKCSHDTEKALEVLRNEPLPEYFDSAYLCDIHYQLFKNTFEWAGNIRTVPFTFTDGSVAAMPEMKRTEWDNAFVTDKEILENLQRLEKTLAEKDNLQGLTREEFIFESVEMFISLKNIHPFIDGNEHTEQFFFERLAKAAGHQLNFSLVTKERMMTAYTQAAQYGNKQPMKDIFEDISNQEKIHVLQEFMNNMKELGRDMNDHVVIAAKEGETYTGIYQGASFDGFVLNAQGTYIIGNQEHLPPEQIKTLKPGDTITFTAPKAEELKNILIPKETLAPLTKSEFDKILAESARIQTARDQIQHLSKIIYGNSKALHKQMIGIIKNPDLGQRLSDQIEHSPSSICPLLGTSVFGLKNWARKNAEEHVHLLCTAIINYTDAVKYTRHAITQEHQIEQNRRGKAVEKPSQNLQNLLCLSPEQQREVLSQSPQLYQELRVFVRNLEHRLSSKEYNAIKHNDYETLAKSIGVSAQKAQEIVKTVQKATDAHQQAYTRTINRSNALAMAS